MDNVERLNIDIQKFLENEFNTKTILDRIEGCIATLDGANEQGKNAVSEYKAVEKLQTEISLLVEMLEVKYKDYLKVEHQILFKFHPKLSRSFDVEFYQNLTSQKAVLSHVAKDVTDEKALERSSIFNDNFKLIYDENICGTELFDFLISYKYLEATTSKDSFISFLHLQPPLKKERMIWIDTFNGKPTNRVITRLVSSLFDSKKEKYKQKTTSYMDLIQCYFRHKVGGFNSNSLKVSLSQLESEGIVMSNQNEIRLEKKLMEIYRMSNMK